MEPTKRPQFNIILDQLNDMSRVQQQVSHKVRSPLSSQPLSFTEYLYRQHPLNEDRMHSVLLNLSLISLLHVSLP